MSAHAPNIVLADDDADDRELTHRALGASTAAPRITDVGDGEALLRHLRSFASAPGASAPFAGLVLLDLRMPGKDGYSALQEIRRDPQLRQIPVVVLSNSDDPDEIERCYDLGANSYISKPVSFRTFAQAMQTLTDYWFAVVELPCSEVP